MLSEFPKVSHSISSSEKKSMPAFVLISTLVMYTLGKNTCTAVVRDWVDLIPPRLDCIQVEILSIHSPFFPFRFGEWYSHLILLESATTSLTRSSLFTCQAGPPHLFILTYKGWESNVREEWCPVLFNWTRNSLEFDWPS